MRALAVSMLTQLTAQLAAFAHHRELAEHCAVRGEFLHHDSLLLQTMHGCHFINGKRMLFWVKWRVAQAHSSTWPRLNDIYEAVLRNATIWCECWPGAGPKPCTLQGCNQDEGELQVVLPDLQNIACLHRDPTHPHRAHLLISCCACPSWPCMCACCRQRWPGLERMTRHAFPLAALNMKDLAKNTEHTTTSNTKNGEMLSSRLSLQEIRQVVFSSSQSR